jgi:hypothetical protein
LAVGFASNMESDGFLLTVAQIAVALAGFSGLVVATRGVSPTGWHPRDIWSLSWMFGASIGALFLALLPILLSFFRLREETIWTIANQVMGAFLLIFALTMAFSGRRLTKLGHRPRVPYFPIAATVLLLICGCLASVGTLGMFRHERVGIFALSLIACLLVSAFALVVFLVLLARAAQFRA